MKNIGIFLVFLSACSSGSLEKHIEYQPFSISVIKVTFDFEPSDTVYLEATTINNIPEQGRRSEVIPVSRRKLFLNTH